MHTSITAGSGNKGDAIATVAVMLYSRRQGPWQPGRFPKKTPSEPERQLELTHGCCGGRQTCGCSGRKCVCLSRSEIKFWLPASASAVERLYLTNPRSGLFMIEIAARTFAYGVFLLTAASVYREGFKG